MKRILALPVVCCLLFVACSVPPTSSSTPSVSHASSVSSAPVSSVPEYETFEVYGEEIQILYNEWPAEFAEEGEELRWPAKIYEQDGFLYYLSLKNSVYSIMKRNLQTGAEIALYRIDTSKIEEFDEVKEFLVIGEHEIYMLVDAPDLVMGGGIPPKRTSRMYYYNTVTGELSNLNEKIGIWQQGVWSFCGNKEGIFIQACDSDYTSSDTIYYLDNDDELRIIREEVSLYISFGKTILFLDYDELQGVVLFGMNESMTEPLPIFGGNIPDLFFEDGKAIFYSDFNYKSFVKTDVHIFDLHMKALQPVVKYNEWNDYNNYISPAKNGFDCIYATDSPEPGPDTIWDSVQLLCYDLQGNLRQTFPKFHLEQNVYYVYYSVVGDTVYYLVEVTGVDEEYSYMRVSFWLQQLTAI